MTTWSSSLFSKLGSLPLLLLLTPSLTTAHASARVEGSTLVFDAELKLPPLNTNLEQLTYLGQFVGSDEKTWVVLTALATLKDSGERAVYLMRSDGADKHEFVYPGRIVDPASGVRILESRSFFGKCRGDTGPGYFSYQIEIVPKRRRGRRVQSTEPSMLIVEPTPNGLRENLKEIRTVGTFRAREKETLRLAKTGGCTEIASRNRVISRKMMSLTPKRDLGEPEEDEEDEQSSTTTPAEPIPPGSAPPKELEKQRDPSME